MDLSAAHELMDRMMAVWPNPAWVPETVEIYLEYLEQLREEIGRVALRQLESTCKRRPSIAEVQEAGRAAWSEVRAVEAESLELEVQHHEEPPAPREVAIDAIAQCRAELERAVGSAAEQRLNRLAQARVKELADAAAAADEERSVSVGAATSEVLDGLASTVDADNGEAF